MEERPMQRSTAGWGSGLLGVIIFSGSLPATRVAVGSFSPLFLTSVRAVVAAVLGGALILLLRQKRPALSDLKSLGIVSIGVVVGFPMLTALALQHITSAHAIVFIGLLPLSTAIFAVLRGSERPRPAFWLFSISGSLLVAGFALSQGGASTLRGDLQMVAAILICGLGYAEGATLARRLGGWQVVSWALILALPFMSIFALMSWPEAWNEVSLPAWAGLAYVSVFAMLLGFVFWYRGLALGGIAAVGQLQLLQPFFGFALSALLLGELVTWPMLGVTALVIICVAGAKRFA